MSEHYNHKQVIVIRKDLKMRRGKECAMAAHASLGAILKLGNYYTSEDEEGHPVHTFVANLNNKVAPWLMGRFAKIVVTVNSEQELFDLQKKADELGVLNCIIKDAGFTEFKGVPTYTAIAIGPDFSETIDKITKDLPLY